MELIEKDKKIIEIAKRITPNLNRQESYNLEKFFKILVEEYEKEMGINPILIQEDPIVNTEEYQNIFMIELMNCYKWLETYNYTEGESVYDFVLEDTLEQFNLAPNELYKSFFARFSALLYQGVRIRLEKSWIPILLKTDNILEYKNLPYNEFFIDTCIIINDIKILGILVENLDYQTNNNLKLFEEGKKLGDEFITKNLRIDFKIERFSKLEIKTISKLLTELKEITKPLAEDLELDYTDDLELDNELSKIVFNFVFNICDMLNNNQVDSIEYITSEKKNKKREKIDLGPLPEVTIKLKPKPELSRYIKKFNEDATKINHKYLVRGFYRIYRDKEKFPNLYKKASAGTLEDNYILFNEQIKQWIKPFYKGEGIAVKKDVNLK